MEDLEKKLILAYSEVESAQSERDEYSRDSGDLDTQLHQLMVRSFTSHNTLLQHSFHVF